jgi:indolepyruvate ferredoxin oxidoreductase, alpha subunit
MKIMGDMLLQKRAFSELVMGNTALVRAMVESGTRVVTSYPGSPTPEIAAAIGSMEPEARPFHFEFCVNEKVATEVAYGAAVNGRPSVVFFKSVGLNVAADTFVQLNHMDIPGGMVVVLGDDPGAHSSQNEQDNRHLARLSYTPMLEPATPGEVYSFFLALAETARRLRMAVILRLTTHVCHATERVSFNELSLKPPDDTPVFHGSAGEHIPIGAMVAKMKARALKRLSSAGAAISEFNLHRLEKGDHPSRGIITAGLPFLSVLDALSGADTRPDILKLETVHPLNRSLIEDFLRSHDHVLVLEELDDFIEQGVKSIAFDMKAKAAVSGKNTVEDWIGEYTPHRVRMLLHRTWPDMVTEPRQMPEAAPVPPRFPQMCPGCGHRSAFHAIGKVLKESDISVADIGCHTLGFLPPYRIGQLLMSMGASTGIAQGLSIFNDERRVLAFLGDSTFFHAGIPGLINAVFNNHKLTLVLMENGTTAMTGHQEHPGTGRNFDGPTGRIPIRSVLEGLGITDIAEVDTYSQAELSKAVEKALTAPGVSVVIARHPCMLKFAREQRRKKGYTPRHVQVDGSRCTLVRECIDTFGCPSFTRNAENGSVSTNPDLCIGDGSCIQTCPTHAIAAEKEKENR